MLYCFGYVFLRLFFLVMRQIKFQEYDPHQGSVPSTQGRPVGNPKTQQTCRIYRTQTSLGMKERKSLLFFGGLKQ